MSLTARMSLPPNPGLLPPPQESLPWASCPRLHTPNWKTVSSGINPQQNTPTLGQRRMQQRNKGNSMNTDFSLCLVRPNTQDQTQDKGRSQEKPFHSAIKGMWQF